VDNFDKAVLHRVLSDNIGNYPRQLSGQPDDDRKSIVMVCVVSYSYALMNSRQLDSSDMQAEMVLLYCTLIHLPVEAMLLH